MAASVQLIDFAIWTDKHLIVITQDLACDLSFLPCNCKLQAVKGWKRLRPEKEAIF